MMGVGVGRSGDPDARRRSAIVLATHLIRGGALEERDEEALLGWAVRENGRGDVLLYCVGPLTRKQFRGN